MFIKAKFYTLFILCNCSSKCCPYLKSVYNNFINLFRTLYFSYSFSLWHRDILCIVKDYYILKFSICVLYVILNNIFLDRWSVMGNLKESWIVPKWFYLFLVLFIYIYLIFVECFVDSNYMFKNLYVSINKSNK